MDKRPNVMIIGGDCRFSYMQKILEEKNYGAQRIYPGEYRADDFSRADIFILPVPVSRDNININAPLSGEAFYFGDFLRLVPEGSFVAGGLWRDEMKERLECRGVKVFDYYTDETLAEKNAVPTAEGVVEILINALPVTVDGLKCAVTGYGRCGSRICKSLKALGADVTAAARSGEALEKAERDGMRTCRLSDFVKEKAYYGAVINTVPAKIIGRDIMEKLNRDCLIVETASAPYGVDFDAAENLGMTVIKAGSLPGKTSPLTAGKIILDSVLEHYGSDSYGN